MNDLLSDIETYITRQDTGQSETAITHYLRGLQLISDDERLPRHIPDTVLIQHYVEFRVVLRRSACAVTSFIHILMAFSNKRGCL